MDSGCKSEVEKKTRWRACHRVWEPALRPPNSNSNLPHNSHPAQAFSAGRDASGSVRSVTHSRPGKGRSGLGSPRGATSVRRSKPRYDSGTWIDEGHRKDKLAPVRLRWEKRTTELNLKIAGATLDSDKESLKRKRAYAVARVARLTADIAPRLVSCGDEGLPIACACGLVGAKKTCRQWWLCGPCRARRTPQLSADIRRGLAVELQLQTEEWAANGGRGMRPQIILLTFTQKHSGDLTADQTAIAEGWRKLYKRMHEDYGRFPYVGVWEVTPGRDGLGHVHMHVAAIWRYRDWSRVREQWEAACPSSQYLDIKARRKDNKDSTPASAANYLGKYLSKGADSYKFDAHLRAEVSAAFYNQRSVIASEGFWRRVPKCCRTCQERYRLVEVERAVFWDSIPDTGVISLYFHGTGPPAD